MGASSWDYKVDYDADIEAALQRLRAEVFASGDYDKVWEEGFADRAMLAAEIAEMAEMMGEEADPSSIERLASGAPPAVIDDALLWSMDSGTHSILDIAIGVRDQPDFGVITALADSGHPALREPEPTTEWIEAEGLEHLNRLPIERWQGVYVIGYRDGAPDSIFFVGCSGD